MKRKVKDTVKIIIILLKVPEDLFLVALKELSLCHKLIFSNPYNLAKYWRKPLVFQTLII